MSGSTAYLLVAAAAAWCGWLASRVRSALQIRPVADDSLRRLQELELDIKARDEQLRDAAIAGHFTVWELDVETDMYTVDLQNLRAVRGELQTTWDDGRNASISRESVQSGYHPDDRALARERLNRTIAEQVPYTSEQRIYAADGSIQWIQAFGRPIVDASGRTVKVRGITQNVTARKNAEAQLVEATEAAATASRAKSAFLANMSHEIRTPMNGVIGMADLLLESTLTAAQRDYADTIRDSAGALLTVINDILDFSKVEAGKLDLEHIDLDLRDTVEDVARLMCVQARPKGLELTATIDPSIPDLLRGDPGRLRQVLVNLCGNAVKFTSRGEIAIDARLLSHDARSAKIRIEVRDTGIGIPADRLSQLFNPFTQVDASTTRRFGGTGLGLSIARRLIELMGGEAGVDSELGRGSTFWFTATFECPPASTATVPQRATRTLLRNRRVLVVDDNATNRKVLVGQLERCGIAAVTCQSCDEALQLMSAACRDNAPFEVALVDQQMPDQDGAEFGKRVIADARLRSTRLVLLTSSGLRGDGQRFAELGFAGYLLKPVTQRDLIDCLSLVLQANAADWHTRSQPIITRHHLRTQREREKYRILVAEDNLVNQKVARITLEKIGYRVDVVANGLEAIRGWESGRYDLILMDCQMPDMDGYEAAREIRRREQGRDHIPIVALTAHAMKGAADECLAAGMDDHLTKPIMRERLVSCLGRFIPEDATIEVPTLTAAAIAAAAATANDPSPPVDIEALRILIDGDPALERELIGDFISSGRATMDELLLAIRRNDLNAVQRSAHSLKGASANLHAAAATSLADQLEVAARSGDDLTVELVAEGLRRELERTMDFLARRVA